VLLEIAKPIALMLCILSLCAVFHAAFLVPASDLDQKISSSLQLLVLAAGISLIGGMIFRESTDISGLMSTLPMQLFCWAAGIMLVLFLVAWYLESNSIFEGHVHF
jgi:hypothetical protein